MLAICTPPKTGTVSLQAALVPKYATKTSGRHTMEYNGRGYRMITVRHPLERWASMYWFTKQKSHRGIFMAGFAETPNTYADEWVRRRFKTPMYHTWLSSQSEYFNCFEATSYAKQEDGFDELLIELRHYGINITIPHLNVTTVKHSWQETARQLNRHNLAAIREWAKRDRMFFNYPKL